jgi:protein-S-isoprenylcysteine O-methyltransferase Ste14
VGGLFLRREPARETGSLVHALSALPALLGPVLVAAAGTVGAPFPRVAGLSLPLVLSGSLFAGVSLLHLGRSFGVFPARRSLVTRGPYGWVRHPVYLGELVALAGLCFRRATPASIAAALAVLCAVALRIRMEEGLLKADPSYDAYRARVRYRLFPYLW